MTKSFFVGESDYATEEAHMWLLNADEGLYFGSIDVVKNSDNPGQSLREWASDTMAFFGSGVSTRYINWDQLAEEMAQEIE